MCSFNSGETLHAKCVGPVTIRRNYFESELGVKAISGPFGHLISTADGGWKKLVLQAVTVVIHAIDTQCDMSDVYAGGIV